MIDNNQAHYLTVTGILVHNDKFLIVKRSEKEKAFPGKWTVPGGKIKFSDYKDRKRTTKDHWYWVIEEELKREVAEEVCLQITDIEYLTNMVYVRSDAVPCVIFSMYAKAVTTDVILCDALTEFKWVSLEEAKNYDLIEGIYEELEWVKKKIK